jgi:hypothetical protein
VETCGVFQSVANHNSRRWTYHFKTITLNYASPQSHDHLCVSIAARSFGSLDGRRSRSFGNLRVDGCDAIIVSTESELVAIRDSMAICSRAGSQSYPLIVACAAVAEWYVEAHTLCDGVYLLIKLQRALNNVQSALTEAITLRLQYSRVS